MRTVVRFTNLRDLETFLTLLEETTICLWQGGGHKPTRLPKSEYDLIRRDLSEDIVDVYLYINEYNHGRLTYSRGSWYDDEDDDKVVDYAVGIINNKAFENLIKEFV